MGQMKFNGVRLEVDDKGVVTAPPLGEDEDRLVVGKISRDKGKWVAVRPDRTKQAHARRMDALAWLVVRDD